MVLLFQSAGVQVSGTLMLCPQHSLRHKLSLFNLLEKARKKKKPNLWFYLVLELYIAGSLPSRGYDGPGLLHDC